MTTLRPHLFLAALLIAVSWTSFGSEWRFLVVEPPPSSPDVFIAPHVHAMVWLVDAWRSLIETLSEADFIDRSLAVELARDGLPMWLPLQALALILLLAGFFRAGRLSAAPASTEDPLRSDPRLDDTGASANGAQSLSSSPSSHMSRFSNADAFRHEAVLDQELTEISHRLGNLLLNPDAHAVAEPIADLGRRVRQLQKRLPVREPQAPFEKRSADAE
jgi:hypothetical protein